MCIVEEFRHRSQNRLHQRSCVTKIRLTALYMYLDRWGPSPLCKKGAESPIFSPSTAAKQLHGSRCHLVRRYGRPRPRQHCVRWGPSYHLLKKGAEPPPQFSTHVYCGKTAGWIKMALGMEVGLGPGHSVLDGPSFRKRGIAAPLFPAHVYCGHGRPSQLLLSSCNK